MTATPREPKRAYHYTSAEAFLSIIRSGCLRASSTHALNDRSELIYGLQQLREYAESGDGGEAVAQLLAVLDDEDVAYENNEYNDVFVASASGRGDSTSQWYRYGDKGRGYAIGFRADAPLAIRTPIPPMDEFALEISVGDFSIVDTWQRVVYGSEKELPELFNALVASTTSIRDKHVEERTRLLADAGPEEGAQRAAHAQANFEVMLANLEIAAELNKLFRLLKGDPWREEQEVRSVAVLRDGGALMKYKPAKGGDPTTYIELIARDPGSERHLRYLPESQHPGPLPIAEVVVGPLTGAQDVQCVEQFLEEHGYPDVAVRRSKAAMR